MSALPPIADIDRVQSECLLSANSGHRAPLERKGRQLGGPSESQARGQSGSLRSRCMRDGSVGWNRGLGAYANNQHRHIIFDAKGL